MSGSGLAGLWERVYAKGSVVHMLTGHAYFRAVRAHMLTLLAVICVLMQKSDCVSQDDETHLTSLYANTVEQTEIPGNIAEDETVKQFCLSLSYHLEQAANRDRTGKLWVQYISQVIIMLKFIRAERTGNWQDHLDCVRDMIPHFHAAGHLPYAKSARLYLQQMASLKHTMPAEEFTLFSDHGYFTIRRSFGLVTSLIKQLSSF